MGAFCNSLEILKPKAQRALDLSAVRKPPERQLDFGSDWPVGPLMQVDAGHRASMEAFLLKTFLLVLVIVAERKKQLLGMSRLQGPQHQPSEDSRP